MLTHHREVSDMELKWAIESIATRAIASLEDDGKIDCPARFMSEKLASIVKALLVEVAQLTRGGRAHVLVDLTTAAEITQDDLAQVLDAVDWPALCDALRLCESSNGVLPLADSVLILKSASQECRGADRFAVDSPAYPRAVERKLAELGRLPTTLRPPNALGVESSMLLVEQGPHWTFLLRDAAMPERTLLDPASYDEDVRDAVADALWKAKGGDYPVATREIVRDKVLRPFVKSIWAHKRMEELPLPIESGCLQSGRRGERAFFVGEQLDLVISLAKMGLSPFLDLPHRLVREQAYRAKRYREELGAISLQGTQCAFVTRDGFELTGADLNAAAGTAFGKPRLPQALRGVFRSVDEVLLELAGADSRQVEYKIAELEAGKPRTPLGEGTPVGIVVRLEVGAPTSGWGVLGFDRRDDLLVRNTIARAEQHVRRMKPGAPFYTAVERAHTAGIQSMPIQMPLRRIQRDHLVIASEILATRGLLHL